MARVCASRQRARDALCRTLGSRSPALSDVVGRYEVRRLDVACTRRGVRGSQRHAFARHVECVASRISRRAACRSVTASTCSVAMKLVVLDTELVTVRMSGGSNSRGGVRLLLEPVSRSRPPVIRRHSLSATRGARLSGARYTSPSHQAESCSMRNVRAWFGAVLRHAGERLTPSTPKVGLRGESTIREALLVAKETDESFRHCAFSFRGRALRLVISNDAQATSGTRRRRLRRQSVHDTVKGYIRMPRAGRRRCTIQTRGGATMGRCSATSPTRHMFAHASA